MVAGGESPRPCPMYHPAFEDIESLSEYEIYRRSLSDISWFMRYCNNKPHMFTEDMLCNIILVSPHYFLYVKNPTKSLQIEGAKLGLLSCIYRKNIFTAYEDRVIDYDLVIMAIDASRDCIRNVHYANGCDPKCFSDERVQKYIVNKYPECWEHVPHKLPQVQKLYELISILEK